MHVLYAVYICVSSVGGLVQEPAGVMPVAGGTLGHRCAESYACGHAQSSRKTSEHFTLALAR